MKRFLPIFTFIIISLVLSPSAVNAAPPAGFQKTTVVGGLDAPTAFEIAPDGRIFIVEQSGKIKIIKNGVLLSQNFDELPALASGDRGLLGIAFDPDFNNNHFVYFHYVGTDTLHHIARLDASEDIGKNGPVDIYTINTPAAMNHAGGAIQFGPDGKLYLALGDNGFGSQINAQNLSNPFGKIIRINKDGTIPPDNPFVGQSGKLPEIWAYGFRNPFRFQFDKTTGELYVGDVGESTWEEVNRVTKGGNYGWPVNEGNCTSSCSGYINPIHIYAHGAGASVSGGLMYRENSFAEEYRDDYYFGDYVKGFIKRLTFDSGGNVTNSIDFDPGAGSVVDMKIGQDGSIYYLTIFPGALYKVSNAGANQLPTAIANANVTSGIEPLTVNFSSAGSNDPEGATLTYLWNFDDGTTSTEANPTKVFSTRGRYNVTLTVNDGTQSMTSNEVIIQVGTAPVLNITNPAEGFIYKGGDSISYNSNATDWQSNSIPNDNFTTTIIFHHNTHIHPFIRATTGGSGNFTIPVTGETAADVWYEIKISVKDSDGLITIKSVNINPKNVNLTFKTNPANLKIDLDGNPKTTPHTTQGVVGILRMVNAPDQILGSTLYEFDYWSDGGNRTHQISTPNSNTEYTANFVVAQPFSAQYFNNLTLTGTPVLTRNDLKIDFDWGGGSPDPTITTDNFSTRWTKIKNFKAGRYKFTTTTDDGVRVYLNNQLIIDKWIDQGSTIYSSVVQLQEGDYEIKVEYFDHFGGAVAKFNWDTTTDAVTHTINPPEPPVTGGYNAQYFNNINLSGTPTLARTDPQINFIWANGSPASTITTDNFSTRWTKIENFTAGIYSFEVSADDGVRLYLDDVLLLDKWIDQATTKYTIDTLVTAGNHTIKMEYYEKGGQATAQMSYKKLPGFNASYWNMPVFNSPPTMPTSAPTLTRAEDQIQNIWNTDSPNSTIQPNHFIARWTKSFSLEGGNYLFSLTSDDGIRMYIDNNLVLDQWNDHISTEYKFTKPLTPGSHEFKIEYYERTGGAVSKFDFKKTNVPLSSFSAQYFNNKDLTGSPTLTRNDQSINFNWGNGSPDPTIPNDKFSARWTKQQNFETSGEYNFRLTSDDGVRFWVDDQLIIDDWTDHASKTYTPNVQINAGMHTLKIEYYENGGGAVMIFQ